LNAAKGSTAFSALTIPRDVKGGNYRERDSQIGFRRCATFKPRIDFRRPSTKTKPAQNFQMRDEPNFQTR